MHPFQNRAFHPVCVLLGLVAFIISGIFTHTIYGFILLLILFIVAFTGLRIRFHDVLAPFRTFWLLILVTFIIHTVISNHITGTSGLKHWLSSTSLETLTNAVFFTARIALLITAMAMLFRVYPPQYYGQALGKSLSQLPFRRAFWTQIVFSSTLALRFIPFLRDEAIRLKMALKARGLTQNSKLRDFIPNINKLLFPLMILSLRRADNIALALVARGYDSTTTRTFFREFPIQPMDILLTFVFTILCIIAPLL